MKFVWVTINVSDLEKSIAFYHDILGLKIGRRVNSGDDVKIAFLGEGETQVELIRNPQRPDVGFDSDISLGFEVGSLDAFAKELEKKSIPIHSGPFQPNPHIRFFYILDPDGLKIQLVERSIRPK